MANKAPEWAADCIGFPKKGVTSFLKEICDASGAKYGHIRLLSRYGKFYTMVDSIGPYNKIGKHRRFHLLDGKDIENLAYQFIDYSNINDCQSLKQKYTNDSEEYAYLNSLKYGFWIPLSCESLEFGYVSLSWIEGQPDPGKARPIELYMESIKQFVPLLFSACRSVITDNYFKNLWTASGIIISSPSEAQCYEHIAAACVKLWGAESTTYIGKSDQINKCFEIVAVQGNRQKEAMELVNKQTIPYDKGLLGYAYSIDGPVISFSLSKDTKFEYHSLILNDKCLGSAMAIKIGGNLNQNPIAVLSVEHELENYFDFDDLRYLTAITQIGFDALTSHKEASVRIAREMDVLFTQMSHDIVEPMTALVADADVLRYMAGIPIDKENLDKFTKHQNAITERAANILETSLSINKLARKHLDAGIDGASTRVTQGKVNLYRLLNSLVSTWEERAASHGVEIKSLFDSLKGIEVQSDEPELRVAFQHLLGNAIKYSFWGHRQPHGSVAKFGRYVSVIGRIHMEYAIVEIQNYGVGILKSEISRVKEKFYRGDLAKKEGRAGTGRGLSSANEIFKNIGGYIEITSEDKRSEPSSVSGPFFTCVKAFVPYLIEKEV